MLTETSYYERDEVVRAVFPCLDYVNEGRDEEEGKGNAGESE